MYFTHHFAHAETAMRARTWMSLLGFGPHQFQTNTHGFPRITAQVDPAQLAEIHLLINALERSEPDSFPSFWDESRRVHPRNHAPEELPAAERTKSDSAVLGWHPPDIGLEIDPAIRRLREAMCEG